MDDLYAIMTQGGFALEGKDEVAKKRTLAITIGKNATFARVPNTGHVGLAEWYPNAKRKSSQNGTGASEAEPEESTAAATTPPHADKNVEYARKLQETPIFTTEDGPEDVK